MNDLKTDFTESKIKLMQKVKKVASVVIEYIAKFENELKAIWEKPKFVRKSNYVLTLDKLQNNINIIEKIINQKEFCKQKKLFLRKFKQRNTNAFSNRRRQYQYCNGSIL